MPRAIGPVSLLTRIQPRDRRYHHKGQFMPSPHIFPLPLTLPSRRPHPQEIKKILQGLAGLKIVGADIVEVAPAYDNGASPPPCPLVAAACADSPWCARAAEITGIAAADIVHDFLSMLLSFSSISSLHFKPMTPMRVSCIWTKTLARSCIRGAAFRKYLRLQTMRKS